MQLGCRLSLSVACGGQRQTRPAAADLSLPCPRAVRSLSFTVDDKQSWQQVFKDAKLVGAQQ